MDLRVKGKAYVIVGGTRDMGFEAARVLAGDGGNVALIGRDQGNADRAAKQIVNEHGTQALAYGADASTRSGDLERAIADAVDTFGRIDGLLCTPGWAPDRNGTVLEADDDDFDAVYQAVFMPTVRSVRAALPPMLHGGGGTIVTTSAYSIHSPKDFLHCYSAMKHAVANFTKNIAKTYGPQGIRANTVCPGTVKSAVLNAGVQRVSDETGKTGAELEKVMLERYKMPVALQRFGETGELGDMMAFLLSGRAGYTSGALITVDGGTDF